MDQSFISRAAEIVEEAQELIDTVDGGDKRAMMARAVRVLYDTGAPVKHGANFVSAANHVATNAKKWAREVQLSLAAASDAVGESTYK